MILIGDYVPLHKEVCLSIPNEILLANLEGPLLDANHKLKPVPKAGPNIFSTSLPDYKGEIVFTLANNHIMDFGEEGLNETLTHLNKNGIKYSGAGFNSDEARKPIILEQNNKRIAIISCCEAQFNVASKHSAGVAKYGYWVFDLIKQLQSKVDKVIVSFHAGIEDSPWPIPYWRELFQRYIASGATIVHNHHSHVPQGFEKFGNGFIFYGPGNSVVDPDIWKDCHHGLWSWMYKFDFIKNDFLIQPLTVTQDEQSQIRVEPIQMNADPFFADYLSRCNTPLHDDQLFNEIWQDVALRAYQRFGAHYLGFESTYDQPYYKKLRLALGTLKQNILNKKDNFPSRKDMIVWHHMFSYPSHRTMVETALGILSGGINDIRTQESSDMVSMMMSTEYEKVNHDNSST